eukprot:m.98522 g.98522  ORF g.98522 m.98522 type:complete len:318 (-) comp9014_c7_seq4:3953-4906(-)
MDSFRSKLGQKLFLALDSMSSGVTDSKFSKTGKLTAEEFVEAGDFLVENFPYWKWQEGLDEGKRKHLPEKKQFLIVKNVPCFEQEDRAVVEEFLNEEGNEDREDVGTGEENANDDDGWVNAEFENSSKRIAGDGVVVSLEDEEKAEHGQEEMDDDQAFDNEDDIPSMGDDDDIDNMSDDDAVLDMGLKDDDESNTIKTRVYDISITYDAHYSTPRVWLYGYDEEHSPLLKDEWKKDFSPIHVDKTVTMERHPHTSNFCATIHPCKHAEAMLSMLSMYYEGEEEEKKNNIDPKFYLIFFLKFIQSMIPNMDYDFANVN